MPASERVARPRPSHQYVLTAKSCAFACTTHLSAVCSLNFRSRGLDPRLVAATTKSNSQRASQEFAGTARANRDACRDDKNLTQVSLFHPFLTLLGFDTADPSNVERRFF